MKIYVVMMGTYENRHIVGVTESQDVASNISQACLSQISDPDEEPVEVELWDTDDLNKVQSFASDIVHKHYHQYYIHLEPSNESYHVHKDIESPIYDYYSFQNGFAAIPSKLNSTEFEYRGRIWARDAMHALEIFNQMKNEHENEERKK